MLRIFEISKNTKKINRTSSDLFDNIPCIIMITEFLIIQEWD